MDQRIVTVIGGSGFLGEYVVRALAKEGYTVRILCRRPVRAVSLKTLGEVGQIVVQYADLAKPETLRSPLEGSFAVVNLAGILYERGKQRFETLHAKGPEALAKQADALGIPRLVHVSALGITRARDSLYATTKLAGEQAVKAAFPNAVLLRPSIVFGPEDRFLNRFAAYAKFLPFLPLIGGGATRFQPVYAGDIGAAVAAALKDERTGGKIYELGGPRIYTFREILEYIQEVTRRRTRLIAIPFWYANLKAFFLEKMPGEPLLTRDQVRLLKYDSTVDQNALQLGDLGIRPTALEAIAPAYLARYRKPNAAW